MSLIVARLDLEGTPVVAVSGELDVESVTRLADALERVLDLTPAVVVVDLADATFIDSTGLAALVAAYRTLRTHGGTLHVVSPPERVRRVFAVTVPDTVLHLYPSREAALEAARPRGRQGASLGSLASH